MTDHTNKDELGIPSGRLAFVGQRAQIWLIPHVAPRWLRDAEAEAEVPDNIDAKRREILFSVCFAESYLLEWVRDDVLPNGREEVLRYFNPSKRRGVREKWKEIPKKLQDEGLIQRAPDLSQCFWSDWNDLVDYRDGIVHARFSMPDGSEVAAESAPIPSQRTMTTVQSGWALRVVLVLAQELHQAAGLPMPDWLSEAVSRHVV